MEYLAGARGSLRLDAGELDHLGPLLGFFGYEPAEVCGRSGKNHATHVGELRLEVGISASVVGLRVEHVDDLGRRASGHADAEPAGRLVARQEIAHSWNVRQRIRTRRARYRERA